MLTRRLLFLYKPQICRYNVVKRALHKDLANKRKSELWQEHGAEAKVTRNLELIREGEEEKECFFPLINQLGVSTNNKKHSFEVQCDHIIRFIKMGAINKNIASQYCHYLADLSRTCDALEADYYGKRCKDLLFYLLRNNKDLTIKSQVDLICDISDTTSSNCFAACDYVINQETIGAQFSSKSFTKLLTSCYRFELLETANAILSKYSSDNIVTPWLFDFLILALPKIIETCRDTNIDSGCREKLKSELNEHILKICELAHRDRVQFITKHTSELVKYLDELGVKVSRSPTLKLSGRCTSCNTFLPTYDDKSTASINQSIKDILHQRLVNKYYVHSSPRDLEKFEDYLHQLYKIDRKPVDLVIDGLNIAYKNTLGLYYIKKSVTENFEISQRRQNPTSQVQVLINAIIRGNMLQNFRKILVIGREHMRHWPGLLKFFADQNIHHYFSLNHTKDDLFQLYAATLNPKTLLVTSDFLRDHLALLDSDKRIALERWIDTHQVWIQHKTLKPVWPTPYEKVPSAHRETRHVHVPIIDFHKLETIAEHEAPPHLNNKMVTWVCCKLNE